MDLLFLVINKYRARILEYKLLSKILERPNDDYSSNCIKH